MNGSRKSKARFLCRFGAVVALIAWVAASSYCSAEFFFGHLGSGADHHHHHDSGDGGHDHEAATTSHEDSGHHHDSDPGGSHGDSCCKSLKAVAQNSASVHLAKLAFQELLALTPFWLAQTAPFVQPETSPPRQAKSWEWVFTPEVCLGPAFRAHAPPLFI